MESFFPKEKIVFSGNPVRVSIANSQLSKADGAAFFSLDPSKQTLLVVGGSLGAKSINEAINKGLDELLATGLQVVWQTGKPYADIAKARAAGKVHCWANEFITKMEYGYAVADIVVARAGAMTVAELSVAKKPVVFVPYPFAAEDHQTVNATALVNRNAALMVRDSDVLKSLVETVVTLSKDTNHQNELERNIGQLAIVNADKLIASEILKSIA